MTTHTMKETTTVLSATLEERTYPPYDALHGTPHAMLWRKVTITTPKGSAAFEQTDYGHPGKLNPWEPRGVASTLTPKLAQLQAVAESLASLRS